jgi:transcription-repair coupling factor (superfamily II helicase)
LNEAVLEESGRSAGAPYESTIDIKLNANIPEKYIPVSSQRMEMYKKISLITVDEDMQDILDEFFDRFGEPPREVERLIEVALLRSLASKSRIKKIEFIDGTLTFREERCALEIWSELFGKHQGLTFKAAGSPSVIMRVKTSDDALRAALSVIRDYFAVKTEIENTEDDKNVKD